MAISFQLTNAGFEPTELRDRRPSSRWRSRTPAGRSSASPSNLQGTVPNATAEQFQTLAENAKKGCPISRALAAVPITMTAKLG